MKKASGAFLAVITLVGMVFGGFLLSNPSNTSNGTSVDTQTLYRTFSPITGNKNATVKISVFSDYLCPYCKNAHDVIDDVLDQYGNEVAVYHRNLIVHEDSEIFARAVLASNKQGRFAEFDNIFFEREIEATEEAIIGIANELGLNIDQFKSDLHAPDVDNTILQDEEDAMTLQVRGTPTLFINGEQVDDFRTLPSLVKDLI